MNFKAILRWCGCGFLIAWCVSCTAPLPDAPSYVAPPMSEAADGPAFSGTRSGTNQTADSEIDRLIESKPNFQRARPGLGTEWGKSVASRVLDARFERRSRSKPDGLGKIYYNDKDGARAMTGREAWDFGRQAIASAWMTLRLVNMKGKGLKSSRGREGDQVYVGERGDNYEIELRNTTASRLEVVVSVDGLDVVNGRPAGYGNRGYVVAGGETLRIAGFRESASRVARFEFGKVKDSYSARSTGGTANVGVIGVAVFAERGTRPVAGAGSDLARRKSADPFPGQRWAVPPR